jgi:hypothetical protein
LCFHVSFPWPFGTILKIIEYLLFLYIPSLIHYRVDRFLDRVEWLLNKLFMLSQAFSFKNMNFLILNTQPNYCHHIE